MSTWYRRAVRKVWPDLPVKPSRHDVEQAGLPERRRVQYAKASDLRELRNRMVIALLICAAISTLAAYLGYNAGREGDRRDSRNTTRQAFETCVGGGELRILVAQSNDLLRRSAVGLVPGEEANPRVARFLRATQPAIDGLLTQAAGRPFHARPAGGEVNDSTVRAVRKLSLTRCQQRVARTTPST